MNTYKIQIRTGENTAELSRGHTADEVRDILTIRALAWNAQGKNAMLNNDCSILTIKVNERIERVYTSYPEQ